MESKFNQDTLFNPTTSREINTINLEQTAPLVEHTLGPTHRTLVTNKSEAISDPTSITTTALFKKPIVYQSNIEWTVDQALNTELFNTPLLTIFQSLEASPGGQALRANAFFRSGARVQLKVSSSPFHSGKLVMYYVPPGVDTTLRNTIFNKVQYPCVYVDAGNSTTAELNIPFITVKDFFATYEPDGVSDYGTIRVAVLNPLGIGTGGPTTVTFAISLHPTENQIALPVLAHNIQLQAAIIPMVAEMLPEILGSSTTAIASGVAGAGIGAIGASIANDRVSEENHKLNENILRNEENRNNNKPMIKDLNTSAPSLSNMTSGGTEHLSLFPQNTYVKTPKGHDYLDDEMDLLRIAKIPSLIHQGTWTQETDPGTTLLRVPITPMLSALPTGETNIISPSYLAHCSQPFSYWRGSIDFHFSFAATEQHRGKIIVAWIPHDRVIDGVPQVQPNPTIQSLSLFPNEIFDLSLNKEFSFSIPYNSETPYRWITPYHVRVGQGAAGERPSDMTFRYGLGTLVMMVYNILSHPSTVTDDLNYNVYVAAGEDFQLRSLRYHTDLNSYQQIGYIALQGLEVAMEQSQEGMFREKANRVGMVDDTINSASFLDDNSEHNLQYLLSKYYPQVGFSFTVPATDARRIRIASLPGLNARAPRGATQNDPLWRNLICHFKEIFAFWHGSLNYFVIHDSTVNTPILLTASHNPLEKPGLNLLIPSQVPNQQNSTYISVTTETNQNISYDETSCYSHLSNLRVNPTIEVTTPYRSLYRRLYCKDYSAGATFDKAATFEQCIGALDLYYTNPSANDIPLAAMVFQSVGSDFRFKYLIPPQTVRTQS